MAPTLLRRASVARWTLAVAIGLAIVELVVVPFVAAQVAVTHKEFVNGKTEWVGYLALGRLVKYRIWFMAAMATIVIPAIVRMRWQGAAHRTLSDLDAAYAAKHPRANVWW